MWYSVRTQLVVAFKGAETMPFWLYIYINFRKKKKNKTKYAMEIKTDFKHLSGCLG